MELAPLHNIQQRVEIMDDRQNKEDCLNFWKIVETKQKTDDLAKNTVRDSWLAFVMKKLKEERKQQMPDTLQRMSFGYGAGKDGIKRQTTFNSKSEPATKKVIPQKVTTVYLKMTKLLKDIKTGTGIKQIRPQLPCGDYSSTVSAFCVHQRREIQLDLANTQDLIVGSDVSVNNGRGGI
uniref:Uncharacterized protein n=2 Tax=Panagrolaimus sp. JU765 TaxID=591449 RepID=A0AC34Q665_9BILA